MVGDQHGGLQVSHEIAEGPRLGLGERRRAVLGLEVRRRVREGARARAAPLDAVVAVEVDAVVRAGRDVRIGAREAVLGRRRGHPVLGPAVLALVRAGGGAGVAAAARIAGRVERIGEVAAGRDPLGLDRDVEAVDVQHRDDEVACALDDRGQARVAGLVAVDEVEAPLERGLVRGPLTRMVRADLHERGAPVVARVHVLGDLHAVDVATLPRLAGQRDEAHEAGVLLGQRAQLAVDLGQRAVGGAAAHERRGAGRLGRALLGLAVLAVLLGDVGDPHGVVEPGVLELGLVGTGVQQHVPAGLGRMIGHVEPETGEPALGRGAGQADAHELRRVA